VHVGVRQCLSSAETLKKKGVMAGLVRYLWLHGLVGSKKACGRAREKGNMTCGDQNYKSIHHFFASLQELESESQCVTMSSEIEVGNLIQVIRVARKKN